jgi:hypothetical protein
MLLIFVLARKRRLDLVTVRAVAERHPPERSGVDESRVAYRAVKRSRNLCDYKVKKDCSAEEKLADGVVPFSGD